MVQKGAPASFNELHTSFVTTEGGTTLSEVLQVLGCISLTPLLVPLILPWVVPPSFVQQAVTNKDFFFFIRGILEYPVIIVFPIWIVTVFAGDVPADLSVNRGCFCSSSIVLLAILSSIVGLLIVNHAVTAPKWLGFLGHWTKIKNLPTGWSQTNKDNGSSQTISQVAAAEGNKLPFITNYRGITIYITILCILAVDFAIFPRRFAKTKDYGISLMDVGTGCFVFANGIVAPEARNRQSPFSNSMKSVIPIVILGLVRLVSVKGIEYQEVVEEYGVHWNFFFTLAGVKLFSTLLFKYFDSSQSLKLATFLSIFYEIILHYNDFQNVFVLNPKVSRSDSFLHANREGLFSVFGYLSIYMASVYIGKIINWKERSTVREWTEYIVQSFIQVLFLWGCYAVANWWGILPCRRTANLSYILFMIALNYSLLWGQAFLSLLQVCLQHHGIIYGPILFYELKSQEKQSSITKMEKLQKMSKEFSKLSRKSNEESLDEQMQELEDRLKKACEEIKSLPPENSTLKEKVAKKIDAIEAKIVLLEQKLLESTSDIENKEDTESSLKSNFVLLPDLSKSPVLLEAICYNGLAVFLFGNLLTGLVNCMIYTMYTPIYIALCYLWCYATVITAASITLYWLKIQLKFW